MEVQMPSLDPMHCVAKELLMLGHTAVIAQALLDKGQTAADPIELQMRQLDVLEKTGLITYGQRFEAEIMIRGNMPDWK